VKLSYTYEELNQAGYYTQLMQQCKPLEEKMNHTTP